MRQTPGTQAAGRLAVNALIAIRAGSTTDLLAAIEQAWAGGDAVLPMATDAPDAAVADVVRRVHPAAFARPHLDPAIGSRVHGLKVHHLPDPVELPQGTALVVMTSGSTGPARPVVLSRAALDASVHASVARLGCAPGAPWLVCLPAHHVAGITAAMRSRQLGVAPIVHDRFDPDTIRSLLETTRPWVSLVPTQLARLLDAGVAVDRFAGVLLGGAAASSALLDRARATGARIVRSYGMTETCGGCVYDGLPLPGVEVRAGSDGRLAVRGDVLLTGHLEDGTLTAAVDDDGWFVTNDRGNVDDNGLVEVRGRADDIIVSGGENVPASTVATRLEQHPGVAAAAVIGRPDPQWGEVVVAVIEAATTPPPTLAELRDHVAATQPRAWAPREVLVVDRLPRTALGKHDRQGIKALLEP